ncbi:MAG TPA: hypothetical protein VK869_08985 [Rubrobacteraceae bacterium]|nr:hypothetical protein [Rubrobacteraceae bacterium]
MERAGLTLELPNEHECTLFPRWLFLVKMGFDTYRPSEGMPRLPLL